MKNSAVGRVIISVIISLAVGACAGAKQKPMVLESGEKSLVMKVESFKFEPDDIKAHQGDRLTVKLENISGSGHNLTIKTPRGDTLVSVDIPAKETVSVEINLAEIGTYPFYCDKPLHSSLGMKGKIEVTGP